MTATLSQVGTIASRRTDQTQVLAASDRKARCRYMVRSGRLGTGLGLDRCTAESAEEGAEIDLCARHLGEALALLQRRLGLVATGVTDVDSDPVTTDHA
jgi:hypothetical protein